MVTFRSIKVDVVGEITFVMLIYRKVVEAWQVENIREDMHMLVEQKDLSLVILDFDKVDFLSSAVLNAFIVFDKKVKNKSGKLRLCGMAPEIREVFVITRLNQLFEICDTREQAIASF